MTMVLLGVKLTHRQRRPTIYRCVDCLRSSVAAFKTSLRAGVDWHPFGAGVCLQEFRDFPFGKIGTVCAGVTFRNAPPVSKGDHVKIATLSINDTHLSVVPEASLNDGAICIFNPLTGVAEICPRQARECAKSENQCDRLLHTFHSNIW